MLKQLSLVIVTAFMLSCTNMPNSAGDLAQNEALQGGLLGGLLCGGAAKLAGLNREQIVIATAGCAGIGAIVGKQLRDRREKYASDEEFFIGEIKAAQLFNSEQAVYKERLITEVNDLRIENQEFLRSQQAGKSFRTRLARHKETINDKQQQAKTEISKMQEELKFQEALYTKLKNANSPSRLANLQNEVGKLRDIIAEVEELQLQLADLNDKLI
ncbi:hypothetical protein QUF50_00640 [Thiotrichales bacterium HSG1]|nr:hypothetical protein [Thiotrichales bacterium HSG1]